MRLAPTTAFHLQASITVAFIAGALAPTPLYASYQALWGFSPAVVTLIFGSYAVTVLAALLVAGSLSDYVGRRPVLAGALAIQLAAMAVFMGARGVDWLLVGRLLQGLATGLAVATVGAGLMDLDRTRGPIANAVAPMLGTGVGSLLAGVLVQFLPAPTVLVYALWSLVYLAQAVGVAAMAETVRPRPGALASLRPQFALPAAVRGPLLVAAPAMVAAWALAGFYASLAPALVRHLAAAPAPLLGGLAMAVMALAGTVTTLGSRNAAPRPLLATGAGLLVGGVALGLLGVAAGSLPGFFLGTAVAGTGFGAGFQGAIRTVVPLAEPHQRAGVLAVVYVIAYTAMGLPAVLAGLRVVHGGGVVRTTAEFGLAVMLLAGLALLGSMRKADRKAGPAFPAKVEISTQV